jgi:hypothetical protein
MTLLSVHRPEILLPDTTPLIHLAAIDQLDLLTRMAGRVVVVDLVISEATADLEKPYAKEIDDWFKSGSSPGTNHPIHLEMTGVGTTFDLALRQDRSHRLPNGGEIAITEWLADKIAATDMETMVVYENGRLKRMIEREGMDANIAVATTRTFLQLAEEFSLVASANDLWSELQNKVTANDKLNMFIQRRGREK